MVITIAQSVVILCGKIHASMSFVLSALQVAGRPSLGAFREMHKYLLPQYLRCCSYWACSYGKASEAHFYSVSNDLTAVVTRTSRNVETHSVLSPAPLFRYRYRSTTRRNYASLHPAEHTVRETANSIVNNIVRARCSGLVAGNGC